ncbi:MAG: indole-3-glycerol phosphate synthase TrpC [Chloroflexi bacterium]|jgi:indole-3-glycerol phosphate synthase|nr:indole-3-glycerol phosphate synthase TrpC [Chloroflexota bacterium]
MILDEIIATTWKLLEERKLNRPLADLDCAVMNQQPPIDFAAALSEPGIGLIAEIKRASPSKGPLAPDLDATSTAITYEESGANAISVLTETEYFKGSLADLEAVRGSVAIPILRKDFIVDPYQIWEARASGADAVLLIAAALPTSDLLRLYKTVEGLAMTALVEVHNRKELERVLGINPKVIGINNRNLSDFSVSLETTLELRSLIPNDKIVVSESGIHTRDDVKKLEQSGVNAILVGEALVKSADPSLKIRELIG